MSKKSKTQSTTQQTKTATTSARKTMPTGVTVNRKAIPGAAVTNTSPRDFLKAIENRGKTTQTGKSSNPKDLLAAIANRDKVIARRTGTGTVTLQDFLTSIENGTITKGPKKKPTK